MPPVGGDAVLNEPEDAATHVVLHSVRLTAGHEPTGRTVHYHGNARLGAPAALQIVRFPGGEGCHLLHLDGNGVEMTDTWHDDVAGAMDQARFEFSVPPSAWTAGGRPPE